MSKTRPTIEGCITAIVTPFRGGLVDLGALTDLIEWQIHSGIDGLVAVGTTGESATLSVAEHLEVIAHCVRVAAGRIPVIAGAGANATSEAIELSRASEAAGADALMHVTPYYNRPTQDGMFRHFEAVASATDLPIVLYNVPSRTGCDLLPDTIERLCAIPSIVAVKDATANLARATELVARVGHRMAILSGDDATAFPLYAVGAHGVISVVSNVAPAEMSEMWDACSVGNWQRGRELHHRLRVLNHLLFVEPNPVPLKAALAIMGKISNELRLPLVPATDATHQALRAELRALELVL
jgi:4-hydroxy-tetrahydrodipicolinate synthase